MLLLLITVNYFGNIVNNIVSKDNFNYFTIFLMHILRQQLQLHKNYHRISNSSKFNNFPIILKFFKIHVNITEANNANNQISTNFETLRQKGPFSHKLTL